MKDTRKENRKISAEAVKKIKNIGVANTDTSTLKNALLSRVKKKELDAFMDESFIPQYLSKKCAESGRIYTEILAELTTRLGAEPIEPAKPEPAKPAEPEWTEDMLPLYEVDEVHEDHGYVIKNGTRYDLPKEAFIKAWSLQQNKVYGEFGYDFSHSPSWIAWHEEQEAREHEIWVAWCEREAMISRHDEAMSALGANYEDEINAYLLRGEPMPSSVPADVQALIEEEKYFTSVGMTITDRDFDEVLERALHPKAPIVKQEEDAWDEDEFFASLMDEEQEDYQEDDWD